MLSLAHPEFMHKYIGGKIPFSEITYIRQELPEPAQHIPKMVHRILFTNFLYFACGIGQKSITLLLILKTVN